MTFTSDVTFSLLVVLGVVLRVGYYGLLLALAFWVLRRMGVITLVRESPSTSDADRH